MNKFTRRRAKDLPNTRALPCLRPIVAACSLLFATGASYAQQAPAEAPAEAPRASAAAANRRPKAPEPPASTTFIAGVAVVPQPAADLLASPPAGGASRGAQALRRIRRSCAGDSLLVSPSQGGR